MKDCERLAFKIRISPVLIIIIMALVSTAMTEPAQAHELVAHWAMEENGGTQLRDSSTYLNHGTLVGSPTWVTGVNGLAIALNGTTQCAMVPSSPSLNLSNAITLAAWLAPQSPAYAAQRIISKASLNTTDGFELTLSSLGKIFVRFNQKTSGDTYRLISTPSYPINGTWIHVAATYDGSKVRMYINGVLTDSLAATFTIGTNTDSLFIGRQKIDLPYRYQGQIDDARIYNYALNASEILTLTQHRIVAGAGANGNISPAGNIMVNHGASQTFTFTPDPNYHIASLLVDGSPVTIAPTYTFANVTGNHTIEVTFAIDTYTITASTGPNGSISPAGSVSVNHGASQTFTFTPDPNYHIASLLVDGSPVTIAPTYTFTNVTGNHTIEVTFAIDTYTITASTGPNGSISPAGSVSVNHGASQTFTFTPDPNYHIASLLVDGSPVTIAPTYTFANVTGNHTISATFAIDTYTITASAGPNGSISPNGAVSVNHGASQTFTFTPAANYHVADVVVDGVSQGTPLSYTFTNVTGNHTIEVTFAINTYTVTASAGPNGSISPAGSVSVNHGASQIFTFTPAANYHVADVVVDGVSQGTPLSYTFTNVTGNHTISVTFAIDTYTITASTGPNGSISPAGSVSVNHGASQTFTFTPDPNYHIASLLVDGSPVTIAPTYTFTNVTGNHTIEVTFAHLIIASAGPNGSISPNSFVYVEDGASQTFTFTPAANYHVSDVVVDGVSQGTPLSYAFTNITGNHTISVTFAIDTYTITASAGPNGSISPTGPVIVNYGASQTFIFTPAANFCVADVVVDGVLQGTPLSYTFTNVTTNHEISVVFAHLIIASAGPNGSISPSSFVYVEDGASQTFTFTPAANYHLSDVVVDGVSQGTPLNYTFTNVTANHMISVAFAIDTHTITASAGPNGSISPAGAVSVGYGANQTFTFTPDPNYYIASLIVDGSPVATAPTYTFTNVTGNHLINVTFAIYTHIITASAGPNGSILPAGSVSVNQGGSQTFVITPDPNYHIASLLVDGSPVTIAPTYTFTNVTGNHTISVTFAIDTYTVTASAGPNGSISPTGIVIVNHGANQTFTFTPDPNYHIASLLVDGSLVTIAPTYTFTNVTGNHTISVTFAIDTYTITASAGPNGSISPTGIVIVNHGANQTFTITPNPNYHIANLILDGYPVAATPTYTFTNVTGNHSISATFATNNSIIAASAGSNGSISPAGAVSVGYGANQTFTFTPDPNYHVNNLIVDGSPVAVSPTYTFTNVTSNHTILVTFATDAQELVAHWAMDEASGVALVDSSINTNTGTLVGTPTWVPGIRNLALSLNGTSQYATVPSSASLNLSGPMSLAVWIAPQSSAFATQRILGKAWLNDTDGYELSLSSTGKVFVRFNQMTSGDTYRLNSTASYPINGTWMHVAATYDGSMIRMYINGTMTDSLLAVFTIGTNTDSLFIGGRQRDIVSPYWYQGEIDDARIYNYALTVSEVLALEQHRIVASADTDGAISPAGNVMVNHGASQTFTITPDPNYHIASLVVDGSPVAIAPTYSFTNVVADHTINVSFELTETVPVITSIPITEALMAQSYTYNVNATGIPAPTFRLLANPIGMIIDSITGLTLWLPSHAGDYAVSIQARNSVGSDTQDYVITVTGCDYMLGDINGSGSVIGSDVTFAVRYFKGLGAIPPDSCYNIGVPTLSHWLYVAGDVNNSCTFAGSDVTRLVAFFKGTSILQNCGLFPPPVIKERRQMPTLKD